VHVRLLTEEERAQRREESRAREEEARRVRDEQLRERQRRWVYFVQVGALGPVKIGCTRDVARRLAGLQTSHAEPLRLLHSFEGSVKQERELHALFERHRLKGEWFSPVPELLSHIAALQGRKE
jgi:hypothetical protein